MITVDGPTQEILFLNIQIFQHYISQVPLVFPIFGKKIGGNKYKTYPRIVGETGGKDFIITYKSSASEEVSTQLLGALNIKDKMFCAKGFYIPSNIWDKVKSKIIEDVNSFKMGSPEDPSNFINAVSLKIPSTKLHHIDYKDSNGLKLLVETMTNQRDISYNQLLV